MNQYHGGFLCSINRRFEGRLKWQEHCLCDPGFLSAGSVFCVESDTLYNLHIWQHQSVDLEPNSLVGPRRSLPLYLAYMVATSLASYFQISLEVSHGRNLITALTVVLPENFQGPRLSSAWFQLILPTRQHLAKVSQRWSRVEQVEILVLFPILFSRDTTLLPTTEMTSLSRSLSLHCNPRNKHGFAAFTFFLKSLSDWLGTRGDHIKVCHLCPGVQHLKLYCVGQKRTKTF